MPDRGVGEGAVDEHHGWPAGGCGCIRVFPFPFGSRSGRGGQVAGSGGCFRWLAGDPGEPSDATGESQHDRRADGAGQRGYRNEVPRFMEMWANHERRWPKTPRHAADPTSPDRDGGQRQGPERQAETAEAIGRVREAEPELSADAQAIEQENKHGGWLEGFKNRLKARTVSKRRLPRSWRLSRV